MSTSKNVAARLHEALHRLPGVPAHERAAELNANATAARRHAGFRNRPLRNRHLRNRPLQSPNGHHGRPPRVLVGLQERIGRAVSRG